MQYNTREDKTISSYSSCPYAHDAPTNHKEIHYCPPRVAHACGIRFCPNPIMYLNLQGSGTCAEIPWAEKRYMWPGAASCPVHMSNSLLKPVHVPKFEDWALYMYLTERDKHDSGTSQNHSRNATQTKTGTYLNYPAFPVHMYL